MLSKLFILITTVLTVIVFAEPPLSRTQDQETSGPYQPSGWRPSGPVFRLPERPSLQFSSSQPYSQVDLTYGPPQRTPTSIGSEADSQEDSDEQRHNHGRKVDITYTPPQVRFSGQNQRNSYVIEANVQSDQSGPTVTFSKVDQRNQRSGRVDFTNDTPKDTISVPRNQPAINYGLPEVEVNSAFPRTTKQSGHEYQAPKGLGQQRDNVQDQEGSGDNDNQVQEVLKYRFLQPTAPLNKPSAAFDFSKAGTDNQRGGIEYQVDLTYGAPQETLAVPPNEPAVTYGPPEESSTTESEQTTTELPTTTESVTEENSDKDNKDSESDEDNVLKKENLKEDVRNIAEEQEVYYIYHPSGLLQRVTYSGNNDQANMAYSAKLKYENVDPIRGPVYTYDPETYVFKRLY